MPILSVDEQLDEGLADGLSAVDDGDFLSREGHPRDALDDGDDGHRSARRERLGFVGVGDQETRIRRRQPVHILRRVHRLDYTLGVNAFRERDVEHDAADALVLVQLLDHLDQLVGRALGALVDRKHVYANREARLLLRVGVVDRTFITTDENLPQIIQKRSKNKRV